MYLGSILIPEKYVIRVLFVASMDKPDTPSCHSSAPPPPGLKVVAFKSFKYIILIQNNLYKGTTFIGAHFFCDAEYIKTLKIITAIAHTLFSTTLYVLGAWEITDSQVSLPIWYSYNWGYSTWLPHTYCGRFTISILQWEYQFQMD